ncbi:MAG: FxsA family protein [Parvularculaceae bacterium]
MIPLLLALFIIGPIAEIYLLLAAGSAFGVWPVVGACIATAVIGGAILRWQGTSALRAAEADIRSGRVPVEAAADAVFLIIAAPLLMTPGFITDTLGFILLMPPARRFIAREALRRLRRSIESGQTQVFVRRL